MQDVELAADRGEQLVVTFTYPAPVTEPVTFVVRERIGVPDPALVKLTSTDTTFTTGALTVDGSTVTVKVHAGTTAGLPSAAVWSLWTNPGADDAQAISGTLRIYEVVQP